MGPIQQNDQQHSSLNQAQSLLAQNWARKSVRKKDSLRLFESFLDKSLALVFVDDGDDFGFVFENFNRALLRFAHLKTKKEIETSSRT